jgi:hypothetical protein
MVAGAPGRIRTRDRLKYGKLTRDQLAPPFVDRHSPSKAAQAKTVPAVVGWAVTSFRVSAPRPVLHAVHVSPPSALLNTPPPYEAAYATLGERGSKHSPATAYPSE